MKKRKSQTIFAKWRNRDEANVFLDLENNFNVHLMYKLHTRTAMLKALRVQHLRIKALEKKVVLLTEELKRM